MVDRAGAEEVAEGEEVQRHDHGERGGAPARASGPKRRGRDDRDRRQEQERPAVIAIPRPTPFRASGRRSRISPAIGASTRRDQCISVPSGGR